MMTLTFSHPILAAAESSTSLRAEGLPFAWALLLLAIAIPAVIWSYRRYAAETGKMGMTLMIVLRCLLVTVLLVLITRPVIDLTRYLPVRQTMLVLIDASRSMDIADARADTEDLRRVGLAFGTLPPDAGVEGGPPGGDTPANPSRAAMLAALSGNTQLDLWARLRERADLAFFQFARESSPLSAPADAGNNAPLPVFDGDATALGDALREILDSHRGDSLAGVFVITDGATNAGSPPEQVASAAKADGVPLYLYGIGIEKPRDFIMRSLEGPRLGFKGESVELTASLFAGNMSGRTASVVLLQNDKEVARSDVTIDADGDYEAVLAFTPEEPGEFDLVAKIEPIAGEAREDNNSTSAPLRVIDDEIKVLYVEQKPRWDFRYLLATLQRDRRLKVSAWLFEGDPGLHELEDSPFLAEFPVDREALFGYQIIILGDVNPESLGPEWMSNLREWVGTVGGGLIFLAGMDYNPSAYANTPLAELLPVRIDTNVDADTRRNRYSELRPIRLTPSGELSPYFQTSDNPAENRKIWESFPGVRWTAWSQGAKPGAEVIAVDPSPERSVSGGVPVIARHAFGSGETIYFGTDETYRWRSRVGEVYYIRLWGQVMQAMSLQRLMGASQLVQLRADRARYSAGETVRISGRIYNADFTPMTSATVPGTLTRLQTGADGEEPVVVEERELAVNATTGREGEFAVEFPAAAAGLYRYHTLQDPEAILEFEVRETRAELLETGMNAPLLESMAASSGGRFFREESLNEFPDLLDEREATVEQHEERKLYLSPWWLLALIILMCAEWTARRLMRLK